MSTIGKIAKILKFLEDKGYAAEHVCAEHDTIYLLAPDLISAKSESGIALRALGAHFNPDEGWAVFV